METLRIRNLIYLFNIKVEIKTSDQNDQSDQNKKRYKKGKFLWNIL